jgi:Tfp pilus assembly major pilin PilA
MSNNVRDSLFVALILAVVAVTSFNHYTTKTNTKLFTDATIAQNRDLANIISTETAQRAADKALFVAASQTIRAEQAEALVGEVVAVANAQQAYITELRKALKARGVTPPEPGATTAPAPRAKKAPKNRTA